jgi:peptidoglycan-associated lipoprotein
MKARTFRNVVQLAGVICLVLVIGGCKKKVAATPPAPPPAPSAAQPTVTLNANPASVTSGQTVTLAWSSTNATTLTIDPGVGQVAPQGSTPVSPATSTTYTITATGSGGSATASARVTVNAARASTPTPTPTGPANVSELFAQNVQDAFFDLDKSDLRDDARQALTKDAEFLRSYPQVRVSLEGHCDERGSTEYNLGLGQRRAEAAKNFLISLGIATNRVDTTSWGKERPFCADHNEACWTQNRRAHFVMAQ